MSQYADTGWVKTEEDVLRYVRDGDDNVPTEPDELDRLFEIVYGRQPDQEERDLGQVWDLICSGAGV